jgi:hypothetical protein
MNAAELLRNKIYEQTLGDGYTPVQSDEITRQIMVIYGRGTRPKSKTYFEEARQLAKKQYGKPIKNAAGE